MKKTIFLIWCALCVVVTSVAQPVVPPTQHIAYSPRYGYMRPIRIIDSVYAGDYYSSMVSLSYTILYNGVPIDSMHKFGTVTLTMRSQGDNYQVNSFVTGSLNLPQDVSLMGMNASSFSLGIINTTVACNRNRPILLDMRLEKLGNYSVILEILNQNNTTKQNIGTSCCNFSPDYYATNGTKGPVWISDTISFELQPDTVYTYLKIDSACSYKWRDSIYQVSGVYRWDYADSIGNDSIVFLYLDAGNYSFHTKETVHICEGSSYLFKNRYLTQSGSYYDTLQSRYGCDSIHQLDLEVHPHLLLGDTIQTCYGEPVVWHGKKLSKQGVYYDSLKSVFGCDSVRFVLLQVRPVYSDTGKLFVCEGSSIVWHGKKLSAEGLYVDSLKSRYGCDSVCYVRLSHYPRYLHTDTAEICENDIYVWRGRALSQEGLYADSLQTRYGCDSVIRLYLKTNPVYQFTDTGYFCANSQYLWRGRVLVREGLYFDSLKTRYGCDSVIRLYLKSHPTYLFTDTSFVCANSQYLWRGRLLTQEGWYLDSLKSGFGCDSVYSLFLKLCPVYFSIDTQTICANEAHVWRGKLLDSAGIYHDSLRTLYGCDSVFALLLRVNPVYLDTESFAICDNETYYWHQRGLVRAGVYFDSLKTVNGCDSVVQLTLKVNPTYYHEDTFAICEGSSFEWHGEMYSEEGLYTDNLLTRFSCDSVCALFLQVYSPAETVLYDTVCEGASYHRYGFEIGPEALTGVSSLHFTDTLQTLHGCDSIVHLYLWVRDFPKSVGTIRGDSLIGRTGTYWYEVDSAGPGISYSWSVSNASWQWFDDGRQLAVSVTRADTATIFVKGVHDCGETSASRLFVKVTVAVPEAWTGIGIKAFPNPVTDDIMVLWSSKTEGEVWYWELCSKEGRVLKRGSSTQNELLIPMAGYAKGSYLLRLKSRDESVYTLKINKL